jgi:cardiolipin synthase
MRGRAAAFVYDGFGNDTARVRTDEHMRATRTGRRVPWFLLVVALAACAHVQPPERLPALRAGDPAFYATVAAHTGGRFVPGNRVDVLLNGDGTFPALLAAIRAAERSVTFAQYFYADGPIAEEIAGALAERCGAGVKGHVLLDAFGANAIPAALVARMRDAGCEVEWFRPLSLFRFLTPWSLLRYNNRSHRRIVVVDGTVGFTGGFGVSTAWTGNGRHPDVWRDTNVTITGPVVDALQAAFVRDWRSTTGRVLGGTDYFPDGGGAPAGSVTAQIVASSPVDGASESYLLFLLAIASAERSILITNPYFVLDQPMTDELVRAVGRGVAVTVLVPGRLEHALERPDQNLVHHAGRAGFGTLLQAGVRIFEYRAALLHAKTMVVDGRWATIGSTNVDARSFALNAEINLTVADPGVAARLEEIFRDDLRFARPITYDDWRARGLKERVFEWFAFPAKSQL